MAQASRLVLTMEWIRVLFMSVQGPLYVKTNLLGSFPVFL